MRRWIIGLAASAAALSLWCGAASAAPLTVTYTGYILGSNNKTTEMFTAIFNFDTDDVAPASFDNTLFNNINKNPTANFSSPGVSLVFDSNDYFYTRVSSGVSPLYEFGISGNAGNLTLKLTGGVETELYQLSDTTYANLDPTKVTEETAVSAVPLPPAVYLFGSALLVLGAARMVRSGRVALSVREVTPQPRVA